MLYLQEAEIIRLHSYILQTSGGLPGVRLPQAIGAIVFDIEATIYYSPKTTLVDLAALYVEKIATGHPFNDGNKRTAFASGMSFLRLNGCSISATNEQLENLAQNVVELVLRRITWTQFSAQLSKLIVKL